MNEPIFEIPQKVYGRDSQVITMRIGKQTLLALDDAARESNRSRNEILSMALEFSLEHMVLTSDDSAQPSEETLLITKKSR